MKRNDNRRNKSLRPVKLIQNYLKYPEGSVLITMGNTKVICTASVEESVPKFLRNTGTGWVTAEYQMLPRSTESRMVREAVRGKLGGRTQEIQRLIGRSLRRVVDLSLLGERTIYIDCDVIQADGGTRTASITAGCVALVDAVQKLIKTDVVDEKCIREYVAAISVGIVDGEVLLDLNYPEDSNADVDMNIIMTTSEKYIEIQSTAEKESFDDAQLQKMLSYGKYGIKKLIELQKKVTDA